MSYIHTDAQYIKTLNLTLLHLDFDYILEE